MEVSDLVVARVVEAAPSRPFCSLAAVLVSAVSSGVSTRLKDGLLVEPADLRAKVDHGRSHQLVDLALLGRDVLGDTALKHLEALVVCPLHGVKVLAELRVSVLESGCELGLARLKVGVGVRDTGLEARVDRGSAIVNFLNALLGGTPERRTRREGQHSRTASCSHS